MLRSETVDEIELEPIESHFGEEGQENLAEGYDEILYRQDVDYSRGAAGPGRGLGIRGAYRRTQILSEIGEIPDEESSMQDFNRDH
jgi:hypothetical protein